MDSTRGGVVLLLLLLLLLLLPLLFCFCFCHHLAQVVKSPSRPIEWPKMCLFRHRHYFLVQGIIQGTGFSPNEY